MNKKNKIINNNNKIKKIKNKKINNNPNNKIKINNKMKTINN